MPPIAAVEVAREDTVLVVTLNRPEVRKAVDGPMARALSQAFRDFDADPKLRVAVLTGAGGVFCAGADLATIAAGFDEDRSLRVAEDGDGPLGITRMTLGKPVIAAVEGYAVAGGLELALWCDLRVASSSAVFGVHSRRWGVPLMDGGTIRYEQWGMETADASRNEYRHGIGTISGGETLAGAERFRDRAGQA